MRSRVAAAVLLALLVQGSHARAQLGDAVASGIAGGLMGGLGRSSAPPPPAPGLYLTELPDWVDPATGSTVRMNAGCGIVVQTSLTGSATKNFLNVVVSNKSAGSVTFDPYRSSVQFESGARRQLSGSLLEVPERGWKPTTIAFPDKRDFRSQALELELVILRGGPPCSIRLRHARAARVPPDARTAFEYSTANFWIGGGVSFGTSGSFQTLHGGSGGPSLDGGVFIFPWIHHGFGVEFFFEGFDSSAARRVVPGRRFGDDVSLTGQGMTLGYAVRLYPLRWLSVEFAPTLGFMSFALRENGESREDGCAFVIRQRFQLEARFMSFQDGNELYLAPALTQTLVPHGEFGDLALRGAHLSGLLFLAVGG